MAGRSRCDADNGTQKSGSWAGFGRPKAVIGKVLDALGRRTGPWQTAIWFTTPNSWLDRRKPVDLLEREPDRVIDAADDVSNPALY